LHHHQVLSPQRPTYCGTPGLYAYSPRTDHLVSAALTPNTSGKVHASEQDYACGKRGRLAAVPPCPPPSITPVSAAMVVA
ncbi:MAG: hypothetical protein KDE46_31765, partial [Caldilineaceae bacterium]|nr:hypothetical protein [Caldilineaceae bacterium]